ncbi:MAG: OsmC family protein [Bacilli bacterium]|nr:OsmC family protein [Bacilli bacterium]
MALDNIEIKWEKGFSGTMTSPNGSIAIGEKENGMDPYHLLFGALASCFYATFLSIAEKKRLAFASSKVEVSGYKQDTGEVRTLQEVFIKLTLVDPSDEAQLEKAALLGTKFCSVHETISKVAKINLEVVFQSE